MRAAFLPLFAAVLGCGAANAQSLPARPYVYPSLAGYAPVVEEQRWYSTLPRDAATTQDVNIDRNLVGAEAPASVDVYALTEDLAQDDPVVIMQRRVRYVSLRPARAWRATGPVLRVRG